MKKVKVSNKQKWFKIVSLSFIFVMTCASLFGAGASFSKYIDAIRTSDNGSLAIPRFQYHRGRLTRTSTDNLFYTYPIKDETNNLIFEDLRPLDTINYFFYISNFDTKGVVNEVSCNLTLEVKCYLERMKKENDGVEEIYYRVGNSLVSGTTGRPETDMAGASFVFYQLSVDPNSPLNVPFVEDNYLSMPNDMTITSDNLPDSFYSDESVNGKLYVDKVANSDTSSSYIHKTGLYLKAGNEKFNKGYLLKITLPEQVDSFETYVTGRLHIEININIDQIIK